MKDFNPIEFFAHVHKVRELRKLDSKQLALYISYLETINGMDESGFPVSTQVWINTIKEDESKAVLKVRGIVPDNARNSPGCSVCKKNFSFLVSVGNQWLCEGCNQVREDND